MNQRDIELLSSYLDGQLKPDAERARLQARLSSDPDLRAVLDDLRSARGLLRQLPMRKAPRNFTLTPKMVGKNPPLPRAYPAFRFVTALATFLVFFTVGLNFLAPQMASQSPAFGMGGGGAPEVFSAQAPAPAATEAPVEEAPAAEPPAELAPLPTTTLATADTAREAATPSEKNGVTGEAEAADQSQFQNASPSEVETHPPIPWTWPIILAGTALASALVMLVMRRLAAERWRRK
ncbi:MAG: anti-sigma factor family protein [Anaerolineales bacterium]